MANFIDRLSAGEAPTWTLAALALVRPLALTLTVAIPGIGSFSVGLVAAFDRDRGLAMADASVRFLQGIPDGAWQLIAAVALGYFGAKTFEVVKSPAPPAGGNSPEEGGSVAVPANEGETSAAR